jgi:hypothetical protein
MYMQRTTSGAAGNGLDTTIKYMCGASGIGMGTTIKHLRCTKSGAAGNGLGATIKCLRRATSAAANNGMSTTITPPCRVASFEVNSEFHTGARPSVRLCGGPELARCVHLRQPQGNITLGSFLGWKYKGAVDLISLMITSSRACFQIQTLSPNRNTARQSK